MNINSVDLVYIDCDLHSSTNEALKFIEPICKIGTIIIFDDYYDGGESRAFLEWKLNSKFDLYCDMPWRHIKGFRMAR